MNNYVLRTLFVFSDGHLFLFTSSGAASERVDMGFGFVALGYIIALILTAFLIFFAIYHVSRGLIYLISDF